MELTLFRRLLLCFNLELNDTGIKHNDSVERLDTAHGNNAYCIRDFPITVWTQWGRVMHICVSKLTIICFDNGLSPRRYRAIIWTNDGILSIRTLETNFSEILSEIHIFVRKNSFGNVVCEMAAILYRHQCFKEFALFNQRKIRKQK